jgi:hypothetical protein
VHIGLGTFGVETPRFSGQIKPDTLVLPRIDWTHPLAQGLVFYGYDTGLGFMVDLVSGARNTTSRGTTPSLGRSLWGRGFAYTNGGGTVLFSNAPVMNLTAAAPYSAACGYVNTGTVAGSSAIFGLADTLANTPVIFYLNISGADQTQVGYELGNAASVNVTGLNSQNLFHTAGAVATSGTTSRLFFDGKDQGAGTTTPTTSLSNNQPIFNGDDTDTASGNGFAGHVHFGALWKGRALKAAEFQQLHYDPYCFLTFDDEGSSRTLLNAIASAVTITLAQVSWVWTPSNIARILKQAQATWVWTTVTGAALGDYTIASLAVDVAGITVTSYVSATDTVSVRFQNESGGTLDLASATLRILVLDAGSGL